MNTSTLKNLKPYLESRFLNQKDQFQGKFEFDSPLSKVSYYRIGGPAFLLINPKTWDDLEFIHSLILETKIPFFILGWGSNLLFADHGYDGLVIRMKPIFTQMEVTAPQVLTLGASLGASTLLKKAQEMGWGGLEHFTGIPGSLGGMIAMNAGTHLGEMKKSCIRVRTVNLNQTGPLNVKTHEITEASFSYRQNHFLTADEMIVDADLRFEPKNPELVKNEIEALYLRRKETQPVDYPSCGSVFMNPKKAGMQAWQVVDRLGLRGHRIGNAQISEKHSNFIINLGGALAKDVGALIDLVKSRAQQELGIELHEEVKRIS